VIDLKHEIKRELNQIEPPDLWERIRADATNAGGAPILELTSKPRRRRASVWLAVAAVLALFTLVGALALLDEDQRVDTARVTEPTTTSATEESSSTTLPPGVEPVTLIARAEHVKVTVPGDPAGWTLDIDVVEEPDGTVAGEFRLNGNVIRVDCAYTDTDGVVIIGGEVTTSVDGPPIGYRHALVIWDGDPDMVYLTGDDGSSTASCTELVNTMVPLLDEDYYRKPVEAGDIVLG
jgi:hypothetical protein